MSVTISRAESWDRIYKASKFINFSSFDYLTVKQSLIDYFKTTHPEFNNWIETDEFVMVLESFAYISELYAYRLDMVANESVLATAQRRDSILNLAKFISYKPSRNIPGIGLVKITSVQSNEPILDANNNNLKDINIRWNDPNNQNWKSQFLSIITNTFSSAFGGILPENRTQVFDQLYELYTINNGQVPITHNVIPYSINLNNGVVNLELVSSLLNENGPYEQPPNNLRFNIVYSTDGLGDTSDFTGFYILTKQGTINKESHTFTGNTTHDSYTLSKSNINNIDVWVQDTDRTWRAVDTTLAQNIMYNNISDRYIYELETLNNDQVKVIFGDGSFAEVPNGSLDFWYRTSDPDPLPIPTIAINDITSNIAYTGKDGNTYNLIFTFSLVQPIQNAAPSESNDHIKVNATAAYYTQNRMVNGEDYNSFLLRDPSILKLKTVNRTYAGHSRFIESNDASMTYTPVNHFGDDLALYLKEQEVLVTAPIITNPVELTLNNIQDILSRSDFQNYCLMNNIPLIKQLDDNLRHELINGYLGGIYFVTDTSQPIRLPVYLQYGTTFVLSSALDPAKIPLIAITKDSNWNIRYRSVDIIANSSDTKFYIGSNDSITILEANIAGERTARNSPKLPSDFYFKITQNDVYDISSASGNYNSNTAVIQLTEDKDNNGILDVNNINTIINNTIVLNLDDVVDDRYASRRFSRLFGRVFDEPFDSEPITLPTVELDKEYLVSDITITGNRNNAIQWTESTNIFTKSVTITNANNNQFITISIKDHVYLTRTDLSAPFIVSNRNLVREWYNDTSENFYKRYRGRGNLNFLWKHKPDLNTRIDVAGSNINDCFIITTGYYYNVMKWLGSVGNKPVAPQPHELRMVYGDMLKYKMMTDAVILRSGQLKPIFGKDAIPELQAKFIVVPSTANQYNDNQIRLQIVEAIIKFFDINYWDFGQTFNFSELSTYIHNVLNTDISSILIAPKDSRFNNLYQIYAREDEILVPSISIDDIDVLNSLGVQSW
jgi:hypothetical protein